MRQKSDLHIVRVSENHFVPKQFTANKSRGSKVNVVAVSTVLATAFFCESKELCEEVCKSLELNESKMTSMGVGGVRYWFVTSFLLFDFAIRVLREAGHIVRLGDARYSADTLNPKKRKKN